MQKVNIHIFEIHIYIHILVYMCIHAVNRSTAECSLTGGTGSLEILSKKLSWVLSVPEFSWDLWVLPIVTKY